MLTLQRHIRTFKPRFPDWAGTTQFLENRARIEIFLAKGYHSYKK